MICAEQLAGSRFTLPLGPQPVLFTLDPARVLHRIGALTPTDMEQVNQRLLRALALH